MIRTLPFLAAFSLLAACGPPTSPPIPPSQPAPVAGPAPVAAGPASKTPLPAPPPPAEAPSAGAHAADASATADLVPPAFQGEWNADLARCGTDLGEMRLTLTGSRIGFYESGGPIIDAVQEDAATVLLRARLSGEGETWQRRIRLRLSEDRRILTDITGESPVLRHRCPSAP